ncbi:MAG: two-component regulator propeller domain-containing protein, partial [Pseudomonadota bacterium]
MLQRIVILLSFLVAIAAGASVAPPGEPQAPMRVYSVADGMSQTRVSAMAQDHDGYLWLATLRGLNRFDGQAFETVTIRDGLRANRQYSLFVDARGDVWSGDGLGGVTQLKGGQVARTFGPVEESKGVVVALAVTDGVLVRAVQGIGLVTTRLDDGTSSRWPAEQQPKVEGRFPLVLNDDMLLWLHDGALYGWAPGDAPPRQLDAGPFTGLEQNATGEVFLLQANAPLLRWSSGGRETNDSVAQWSDEGVATGVDAFGRLWTATDDALISPLGTRFAHPAANVADVFVDRQGVVWMEASNGLVRFLGARFMHIPLSAVDSERVVYAVHEDSQRTIWLGGEAGLMLRTPEGEVRQPGASVGLPPGRLVAIASDGQGHMLLSYPPHGVYRVPDDLARPAKRIADTDGTIVPAMVRDHSGALWILDARQGLLRLDA